MLEPLVVTRVVSTVDGIATLRTPGDAIVLVTAPDEAMVIGAMPADVTVDDPHAIVAADTGWRGAWFDASEVEQTLGHGAKWSPTTDRPALAQGMVHQLPVKLWLGIDRTLIITPHTVAEELATRIGLSR